MKKFCIAVVFCLTFLHYTKICAQSGYNVPKDVEISKIFSQTVMDYLREGKVLLIEAHERERYSRYHLQFSINIPFNEVENMEIGLPKNMMLAVYCG